MGWVVKVTFQPLHPRKRDRVLILEEAALDPRPIWMGAKKTRLKGFDPWTIRPVLCRSTD